MTDVGKYIAAGRCKCCGAVTGRRHWTPNRIVAAFRADVKRRGRTPTLKEWQKATPNTPAHSTVQEVFGNWSRMRMAAGFEPSPTGHPPIWDKDKVAEAMLDELLRTGAWPLMDSWTTAAPGRPTRFVVKRLFGSWDAAKKYAGWDPDAASRPAPPSTKCQGCDCDLDVYVPGCRTCDNRRHNRTQRARRAAERAELKAA